MHEDTTQIASIEDMFTVGEILEMNGSKILDFPTVAEAVKAVEYLVQKNRDEFPLGEGEGGDPAIDSKYPLFNKYFTSRAEASSRASSRSSVKNLEATLL